MLKYISGDCGSAKTYVMIEMIKRTNIPYLVVHSELQLMKQSVAALGDICTVISSETHSNVEEAVNIFLKQPSHRVLIISERAFLRISDLSLVKNRKIMLDDVVSLHCFKVINTEKKHEVHKQLFTRFTDLDKQYCTAVPITRFNDDLLSDIHKRFEFIELYDEFRMNSNFFSTKIQDGHEVYRDDCNQLSIMAWVDVQKYVDGGLDMTFMANQFTESLLYRSNPGLFTEVTVSLRQRTLPVKDRLKVFYFLDKKRFTSTFRTDNPNALVSVQREPY